MSTSVVETDALGRRYGNVVALDALTVRIDAGITGLVGANGAGKSTLIKVLLGLVEPTSGTAQVLGHAIDHDPATIRRLVGYMPEHDCLPPDMSATEFVTWLARCSGFPPTAARERAAEVLRHVGLFEERYRMMGGYSTGMAQRVKLAQALVHDPQLLILDEPTNGLDPAGRDEMLALIERTGREFGISVLVSSHLLGELERMCDAVVLLDNGKLIRAERLGVLTGMTSTLIVEIDGDADAFARDLRALGVQASAERQRVLVTLTDDGASENAGSAKASVDDRASTHTLNIVRDVAVRRRSALLRMERRRGHLEDLFATSTA